MAERSRRRRLGAPRRLSPALALLVVLAPGAGVAIAATSTTAHTVKPAHAAVKPAHAAVKPAHAAVKPAHAAVKPAHAAVKPAHAAVKPAHAAVKPAHAAVKPAHAAVKPAHAAAKPAHAAVKPAHAAAKPAHAAAKPAHAAAKPAQHHHKPKPQPIPPLTGWLAGAPAFPQRTLVLIPPAHHTLTAAGLTVTENGTPVGPLQVTTAADAPVGGLGVVFVVDQDRSMSGVGLTAAMAAVHGLVTASSATQEIGMITYDALPSTYLALTPSAHRIDHVLASTPWTGQGNDPAPAVSEALAQLSSARIRLGAVVVISDGVGIAGGHDAAYRAVQVAVAAHTPVITFGLRDAAATPSSLQALAQAVPGTFATATPASLPSQVDGVEKSLAGDDLVAWRSPAGAGRAVQVSASAAGIPGAVSAAYQAPAAPRAAAPARARHAAPAHRSLSFTGGTLLSSRPSFDPAPPPAFAPAPATKLNGGFWSSSAAVTIPAIVCAVLFGLALALALRRPSQRTLRVRVGSFIPVEGEPQPGHPAAERPGSGPLSSLQHGAWWPPFVQAVQVSRNPRTPGQLVKRAALAGVACGVLVGFVSGSAPLGFIPLLAWPFVLRGLVFRAVEKQRASFRDSLPTYLQDLASSIRVGRTFVGALSAVADGADEPTRSELERAVTDEALGRPLEQCLEAIAGRMASTDMEQVALIAGLNRRSGSNVAESLDRVAEGARERADLYREMKALTAQARMSSLVLTGLPGFLLVGLTLISPQYAHPLFHTTLGICALVAGALMVFAGWRVMSKISNVGAV